MNNIFGNTNWLIHYGIKGQKWGVRRFRNPDGTLTEAGKARYGKYVQESGEYFKNARQRFQGVDFSNPKESAEFKKHALAYRQIQDEVASRTKRTSTQEEYYKNFQDDLVATARDYVLSLPRDDRDRIAEYIAAMLYD